jgi:hypothetical protein
MTYARRGTRSAISRVLTALLTLTLIGVVVAGLVIVNSPSGSNASSTPTTSSFVTSSATPMTSTTSANLIHITTSLASTHITVQEGASGTTITSSGESTNSAIGNYPSQNTVFGDQLTSNYTLEVIPADTLVWTSWTLNSTVVVNAAVIPILEPPQNANFNVTAATYVNGQLVDYETYQFPPSANVSQSISLLAPMGGPKTVTTGSTVSIAFLTPLSVSEYFDPTATGVQTNEATVSGDSSLIPPSTLPSATSTLSLTAYMWAFNIAS